MSTELNDGEYSVAAVSITGKKLEMGNFFTFLTFLDFQCNFLSEVRK
jgi:hypothetical protein